MLCQQCQKRVANVHFTQIINNNKVEKYLCERCAKENSSINFASPHNINDFLSGFIGGKNAASYVTAAPEKVVCDKCGMTYDEFSKTGKVGCGKCYDVFEDRVKPLLKRLHGSLEHHGKLPASASESVKASREIENLKKILNEAIKNEQYEKAAELRDKIRNLELAKGS